MDRMDPNRVFQILVIDDEVSQRNILKDILEDAGYNVDLAENGEKGLQLFSGKKYPIVLTDLKMPGKDGLDVLREIEAGNTDSQVIIMTAFGTIPGAVSAIKIGAYDYLTKPFKKENLLQVVSRAVEKVKLLQENARLKKEIKQQFTCDTLIGKSPAMQEVFKIIKKVAATEATVLIGGESGTGKELVAHAIHSFSHKKDQPFVALNCGAIPESLIESELFGHEKGAFTGAIKNYTGKFEQAQGGTIFLDEIGTMRMDLQIRLLRVLQEKKIEKLGSNHSVSLDVRVIAASNENLLDLVENNKFRSDLYHRLNVFAIELPPLKKRTGDIALLVRHFLEKYAVQYNRAVSTLTPAALAKLEAYTFPGNVRELENIIEKTVILADHLPISEHDLMLPENINEDLDKNVSESSSLPDIELNLIHKTLTQTKGSIAKAAEILGISYKTLQYRIKKHNISIKAFK